MMGQTAPLPDFASPPVIETVLGVEFAPLENWEIPVMGLYWAEIRDRFPLTAVHPPLATRQEEFHPQAAFQRGASLLLSQRPDARLWFMDAKQTRLIQVQRDRFVQNWRKTEVMHEYPRYRVLIKEFGERWDHLRDFMRRNNIADPTVQQCEVTYVNHIDQGCGWETPQDLSRVFRYLAGPPGARFLPSPEFASFSVHFRMPEDRGRLRAEVVPVVRDRDGKLTIQLRLVAKGIPTSSAPEDIRQWMDLGHEWVVRGFADMTTEALHTRWGRRA